MQPVLDALRGGRFFVTTGEVLIPELQIAGFLRQGEKQRAAHGSPLRAYLLRSDDLGTACINNFSDLRSASYPAPDPF